MGPDTPMVTILSTAPVDRAGAFGCLRASNSAVPAWAEPIGDGGFAVYFGPLRLGWLDEVDYRIMDVKERAR